MSVVKVCFICQRVGLIIDKHSVLGCIIQTAQTCFIYELKITFICLEAKPLTRAKAVGADGPFWVVRAHVTLLPLLLWERGIGQGQAFVFRERMMENQTWDATARASFLWWFLGLSQTIAFFFSTIEFLIRSQTTHPSWKIVARINWPHNLGTVPLCFTLCIPLINGKEQKTHVSHFSSGSIVALKLWKKWGLSVLCF